MDPTRDARANGMKNKKTRKTREVKKTKKKWETRLINAFAIVAFGVTFLWIGMSVYNEATSEKKMRDEFIAALPDVTDTIEHKKICMVDDIYQGDYPTLAVRVRNKTYYGCSQKAIRDLTGIDSLREAIDPVSQERVDKSKALIAIHPDRDGKVVYFGSKDTYGTYLINLKRREEKK